MSDNATYNKLLKERRVGRFSIESLTLEQLDQWQALSIFANFIVVRAEHDFVCNRFLYTAYSELFAPTKAWNEIPSYKVTFVIDEQDCLVVEAKQVDE